MQQIQDELDADYPELSISIVGVNEFGFGGCQPEQEDHECASNVLMTTGRDLPWLQDGEDSLAWDGWAVTYRDVVVLDSDNRIFAVYNVTDHNLSTPEGYEGLRATLLAAAGEGSTGD